MKLLLILFAIILVSITVRGQDTTHGPILYAYDIPFDSLDAASKDTVRIYMVYVDTTMTDGVRTIKINGVYHNFYYKFPVHPEVKYKIGFGIKLKRDAGEMALVNDHQHVYHEFSFGKYLDEIGMPLAAKYLVILAIGLNYQYVLPDN